MTDKLEEARKAGTMTATEEALLAALWGALEAQDAVVRNYDDYTHIDAHVERGQLAFNILARLRTSGFAIVPRVATDAMIAGGQATAYRFSTEGIDANCTREVWSAMIAAAQGDGT